MSTRAQFAVVTRDHAIDPGHLQLLCSVGAIARGQLACREKSRAQPEGRLRRKQMPTIRRTLLLILDLSFAVVSLPAFAQQVIATIPDKTTLRGLSFIKTSYTRNINDLAPSSIGNVPVRFCAGSYGSGNSSTGLLVPSGPARISSS